MLRRHALLAALCLSALTAAGGVGRASNGTKGPANGIRSLGRGGTDIAWAGDPTAMNSNPAAIVDIPHDELAVAPIALFITARYEDAENSTSNRSRFHPYANVGATFTASTFGRLFGGGHDAPPAPPAREWDSRAPAPVREVRSAGDFRISAAVREMPARADVVASGSGAIVRNVAVVAKYARGTAREYSTVVATAPGPIALNGSPRAVRLGLQNLLPEPPEEIVVYGTVDGGTADVKLVLDGSSAGAETVTPSYGNGNGHAYGNGNGNGNGHARQEPPSPSPGIQPVGQAEDLKFGMGFFVQAGAGSNFKIATELYPEGVTHSSDLSFISLTPTIGYKLLDWLSFGGTLQINYGQLATDHPVTQSADIMKGALFPSGSLDAALGAAFGIPSEFGPSMKYTMNTSDQHAPGTSITHTDKPNDVRFSEITGTCRIFDADSVGLSGRLGLQAQVTDRLRLGLTFQTRTMQEDYRGRSKIDYNKQIEGFIANPTYGHSNEVPGPFGIPTEARFTFDQVWNQGVVDIWTNGVLTIPNFPLPSGSILSQLPNGGANGFAADYDLTIKDHQLPAEIGLGLAYELTEGLSILFDYKRIFWSQAMDEFVVELRNGSNPDVNALVGSDSLDVRVPLDWADQNVFGIGTEAEVLPWLTLRVGYQYAKNPVPEETMLTLMPVIAEHHITTGCSIRVGTVRLDIGLMHVLENTVRISSSEHTRDLNGSKFSASQDFISIGFTYDY